MKTKRDNERGAGSAGRRVQRDQATGRFMPVKEAGYATMVSGVKREAPTQRIARIRAGVPAAVVSEIADNLGVPKAKVIDVLGLSSSSLSRLERTAGVLDPESTERVDRIAAIEAEAIEVLGEQTAAAAWLRTPNHGLGGQMPLEMLDTEIGAEEVRRVLAAIRYGGVV